jgi:hypothetical protein
MSGSFKIAICCGILMLLASLGCEAVPSAVPSETPYVVDTSTAIQDFTPTPFPDPTATPVISLTVNTTPTRCTGFVWAHGTVAPALISQVQNAMRTAGVEGSVHIGTFGETDSCGNYYGAQDVDYGFTVQVGEFDTRSDIASKLATVQEIARRFVDQSPADSLGNVGVTFMSGELGCTWRFEDEPWEFFSVTGANGGSCLLPTNDLTRPLAAALATLSVDLACESFTMTADMVSVSLDCQRPEGANHYGIGVTFNLDSGGSEGTCFHGWPARESDLSSAEPVTLIEHGKTLYEQKRSFAWTTNNLMTIVYERIQGERQATFPADTREKVYLRALREGVIRGAGTGCW